MYMKKILTLIVALLTIGMAADAQVQIKKKSTSENIYSGRMGNISVDCMDGSYFLAICSTNQFDKFYVIHLGENAKDAITSIESFIEIAKTIKKGESYDIETPTKTFTIYKGAFKNEIWFKASGHAGYAVTNVNEMNKILDAFVK